MKKLIVLFSIFISTSVVASFNGKWVGDVEVFSRYGPCNDARGYLEIIQTQDTFHLKSFFIDCKDGEDSNFSFAVLKIIDGKFVLADKYIIGTIDDQQFELLFEQDKNNYYLFKGDKVDGNLEIKEAFILDGGALWRVNGKLQTQTNQSKSSY